MGKTKSFYSKIKPTEKKEKANVLVIPEIDNEISDTKTTAKKGMPVNENEFKKWYSDVRKLKPFLPENPDDEPDYDYRAFYERMPDQAKELRTGNPNAHFNDIGKRPSHPTFSNESIYHTKETPGGQWSKTGNKLPNGQDQWQFEHSDYTAKNLQKTTEYLKNNNDGSVAVYKGGAVLPEVTVKPKEQGSFYDKIIMLKK